MDKSKNWLGVNDVAKILNCSKRTVFRFAAMQKMPEPMQVSGASHWPAKDIGQWIQVGCPSRKTWDVIKQLEKKLKEAKATAKTAAKAPAKRKTKPKAAAKKRKKR
jgi:predicted DNA-binding transcriptional regulator AlpA